MSDDPGQQRLGHELRPLSLRRKLGAPRALTRRDSTSILAASDASVDIDRQPLLGELVCHGEALELLPVGAWSNTKSYHAPGSVPTALAGVAVLLPRACVASCAAAAGRPRARAGRPGRRSCDARRGRERYGAAIAIARIAPTAPAPLDPPASFTACGPGSARRSRHREQRAARRTERPRSRPYALDADEPARSHFCRDFLHHLDLEVRSATSFFSRASASSCFSRRRCSTASAEPLAPDVDRLFADPVPLGHHRHRLAICLALIATICSSVKRTLRIAPSESGASLQLIDGPKILPPLLPSI